MKKIGVKSNKARELNRGFFGQWEKNSFFFIQSVQMVDVSGSSSGTREGIDEGKHLYFSRSFCLGKQRKTAIAFLRIVSGQWTAIQRLNEVFVSIFFPSPHTFFLPLIKMLMFEGELYCSPQDSIKSCRSGRREIALNLFKII